MAEKEPTKRIKLTDPEINFVRDACREITIQGKSSPMVSKILKKLDKAQDVKPPKD